MSRTDHHRKPGTPPRPRKKPIPEGRHKSTLRRAMAALDATLDTAEHMSVRRTR